MARIRLAALTALQSLFLPALLLARAGADQPDHSKEHLVIERFDTSVRIENDGTSTTESMVRTRIQSEAGVRQFGQLGFGYNSAFEDLEIVYVRVTKPDGTVIETSQADVQEVTGGVQLQAPVYTDYREKHVTVPGLRPGDMQEYQIRITRHTPVAQGEFWLTHDFVRTLVVLEERLQIDVPRDRTVKVKTRRVSQPALEDHGERRHYVWRWSNPTALTQDQILEQSTPLAPDVELTTFGSWAEVGRWYADLARDQAAVTSEIEAKAAQLVAGATSLRDSVDALYDYVAQNFRYVSLSLGQGRYQPHRAAEVLANQYGDCKDKHTVLSALLAAMGVEASPALIHSWRELDPELPSPAQFDHMITVIRLGADTVWLDTSSELAPSGLLMLNLRGKSALLIPPSGDARLVETPAEPPFHAVQQIEVSGSISEFGSMNASVTVTLRGDDELLVRTLYSQTPESSWPDLTEQLANSLSLGGTVSEVKVADPQSTREPFTVAYQLRRSEYADLSNDRAQLPVPLPELDPGADVPTDDSTEEPIRLYAEDAVQRATLALPSGVEARAPVPVNIERPWAEYSSTYEVLDGRIKAVRTLRIKQRRLPLSSARDVEAFTRAIRSDAVQTFALAVTGPIAQSTGDSSQVDELFDAGYAALERRNHDAAIRLFLRVLEAEPEREGAWNNLGRAYLGKGRLDRAEESFRKAIEVDPYEEYAYNNLGLTLWRLGGRGEEAAQAFKRQLDVNPLDQYANANLGRLYKQLGRFEEAAPALETAVSIEPDNRELRSALIETYLELGRVEDAADALSRRSSTAGAASLEIRVAYELAARGLRLEQARDLAAAALEHGIPPYAPPPTERNRPTDFMMDLVQVLLFTQYWHTLGLVHLRQGDPEHAEPLLAAAWQNGLRTEAGLDLAEAYLAQGKEAQAVDLLAFLAQSRPRDNRARARLDSLGTGPWARPGRGAPGTDFQTITLDVGSGADREALLVLSIGASGSIEQLWTFPATDDHGRLLATLRATELPVSVPPDTPVKLFRVAGLYCSAGSTICDLTFVPSFTAMDVVTRWSGGR